VAYVNTGVDSMRGALHIDKDDIYEARKVYEEKTPNAIREALGPEGKRLDESLLVEHED